MIHRSFKLLLALSFLGACAQPVALQNSAGSQASLGRFSTRQIAKPPVLDIPSPNFNARPDNTKISAIVLHHTAMTATAKRVAEVFQRKSAKVSSHYIVDRTGYLVQPVADKDRSWHAGRSTFQGEGNVNNYSIGIEICNVGDSKEPYPEAQYDAIIKLVAHLVSKYNIPLNRITRHRDISIPPGRKIDTSNNFSVSKVLKGVEALLNGQTLPEPPPAPEPPQYPQVIDVTLERDHDSFQDVADVLLDNENRWKELKYLNPSLDPAQLNRGTTVKIPTSADFFDIAEKTIR